MKALRYALIAIAALFLLLVIAVGIAVAVINPNDYKPQIENAVEESTNLDLILTGDIGWSFMPIGLEINDVEAKLDDRRLVALDRLEARVSLWSLITMSPAVHTFALSGLDAHLVKNKEGQGNWTRIMPEGEPDETATPESEPAEPTSAGGGEPLAFSVEEVLIDNARLHYSDETTGQSLTLENVSVTARDIALGKTFPLELGFRVATNQPELTVNGQLSAALSANEALNAFTLNDLDGEFDLTGAPFNGNTVTAGIAGKASANLDTETASLSELVATFANLELTANLDVKGFGAEPQLSGNIDLAEFSIRDTMDTMGLPAIETRDPDVLNAAAFSTTIGGKPGVIRLSDLLLTLDDTQFQGDAGLTLANTGINLTLQGNSLNVDRYLPPKKEGEENAPSDEETASSDTASTGQTEESDLLPLETIRSLALDIDLGLDELIASGLTISNLKAVVTADNGLVNVKPVSGDLYDGSFNLQAKLDARSDNPKWTITERTKNVQILPLLIDLAEVDMLEGGANISADITTRGNRIATLRNNVAGTIDFNLDKGAFRGMNLTHLACQGIAMANQESLSTNDWGDKTPFNDMSGRFTIDGNTLTNNDLTAALAGMKLGGKGTVDAKERVLDYEAGLRVVGEIHRDEACRVTKYVEGTVIPVECRGDLAGDPAALCSFDGSRFRDTLKDMAANAAKQKAKEEVDKAKEKAKKKAEETIKEKLGDEVGDKLKNLF
ncbi:AsmA protein [Tamilnaduibacter salinus]|uniref:AsmA protein n=1 Tax=Tamilnaduibacter salinus TaxID=1484056 RepID=A0A2U1CVX3_9GAMM|nr:AsmA family protein [Tamilnaduibacter salinus]PVY75887.1 AsmA protein [Tamilnaduibacter salinus]